MNRAHSLTKAFCVLFFCISSLLPQLAATRRLVERLQLSWVDRVQADCFRGWLSVVSGRVSARAAVRDAVARWRLITRAEQAEARLDATQVAAEAAEGAAAAAVERAEEAIDAAQGAGAAARAWLAEQLCAVSIAQRARRAKQRGFCAWRAAVLRRRAVLQGVQRLAVRERVRVQSAAFHGWARAAARGAAAQLQEGAARPRQWSPSGKGGGGPLSPLSATPQWLSPQKQGGGALSDHPWSPLGKLGAKPESLTVAVAAAAAAEQRCAMLTTETRSLRARVAAAEASAAAAADRAAAAEAAAAAAEAAARPPSAAASTAAGSDAAFAYQRRPPSSLLHPETRGAALRAQAMMADEELERQRGRADALERDLADARSMIARLSAPPAVGAHGGAPPSEVRRTVLAFRSICV